MACISWKWLRAFSWTSSVFLGLRLKKQPKPARAEYYACGVRRWMSKSAPPPLRILLQTPRGGAHASFAKLTLSVSQGGLGGTTDFLAGHLRHYRA